MDGRVSIVSICYYIMYARHYKPRLVFFLLPFFTVAYIVERLVLQTNYVLYKEICQFLSLKSAVSNQERVIMACVRYMIS